MIINKEITTTGTSITLPAGQYWIGDLSYVMPRHWERICEMMLDADNEHDGLFEIDGFNLWLHSTEYGDGIYQAKTNTLMKSKKLISEFCVDAGIIGIVPMELTNASNADYSVGMKVTIADIVSCTYEDGFYIFSSSGRELVINSMPETLAYAMSVLEEV
jgi:hypothetical protein